MRFVQKRLHDLTLKEFNEICRWASKPIPYHKRAQNINKEKNWTQKKKKAAKEEREWGCEMIGKKTGNWTTELSETFVKILLELLGHTVTRPVSINGLKPDWETNDAIYEVKCETWTVDGTAGEKITGTPHKYRYVSDLYGKKVYIVTVAYTQYDLTYGKTPVFGKIDAKMERHVNTWKNEDNIEFVKITNLIDKVRETKTEDEIETLLKNRKIKEEMEMKEKMEKMEKEQQSKPFLKWIGGKGKIKDTIASKFPNEINNYREPFVGGGSVLLKMLQMKEDGDIIVKGKVYAYDENKDLIRLYKDVQNNLEDLCIRYNKLIKEYSTINDLSIRKDIVVQKKDGTQGTKKEKVNTRPTEDEKLLSKENYYYYTRNAYNNTDDGGVDKSAYFLFLNKTGFRGMHREGDNGFNIPFGNYKTPPEVIETHIRRIRELIKDVIFEACDFTESLSSTEKNDFIYLDPPYYPINENSFVKYNKNGFNQKQHKELFDTINNFDDTIKWTLSNFNSEKVVDCFQKYNIEYIDVRHTINSKDPGKKAQEVLIYN